MNRIETEIWQWQNKWKEKHIVNYPDILHLALKQCDKEYFPSLHELLRTACTLPVTSCENERAKCSQNLSTKYNGARMIVCLSSHENSL